MRVAAALAALGVAAQIWCPPALAVHWSQAGGDSGRSGYQPLGDGTAPVEPLWRVGDSGVVTSIVITGGRLQEQRVVYGTADGRVHLRRLLTGAVVGPEGGVAVEGTLQAGVFGDGPAGGSVAFAESSAPTALGHVFVVHNALNSRQLVGGTDDDVEITVIDEQSGAVVQNLPVPGTIDAAALSPAVLSPPEPGGRRHLLFLAGPAGGAPSLHAAEMEGDRVARIDRVEVAAANPLAAPAVAFLPGVAGRVEPHATVPTAQGLRTFALRDLRAPGPFSFEPVGRVSTAAVPVTGAGLVPGQPGSGLAGAPVLYAAGSSNGETRVVRLEPGPAGNGPPELLVRATSPALQGTAAPAVTVVAEVVAGQPTAGWIVVTTDQDLYALDARSLALLGRLRRAGEGAPPGFGRTVAAAAGRLAFASRDDGEALVVDLDTVAPLEGDAFDSGTARTGGGSSAGQPAISRGLIALGSDRGLVVYRTRCGNAIGGTQRADQLTGGAPGDAISGRGGADLVGGGEGDDCLDGGDASDRVSGDAGDDTLAGGNGDDQLNGGTGEDELRGGPGDDRLSGGAGADRLVAGAGADVLSGGPGDDALNARGGGTDRIRCGAGADVALVDRTDRVAPSCERVLRR